MPRSKKDDRSTIIAAALPLFAHEGLEKVTMKAVADAAGLTVAEVQALYDEPIDILQAAFRSGQMKMETKLRQPVFGDVNAYLDVLFDGLMEAISAWGPELYLGTLYQATKDKVLREMFQRSSETLNLAVKAFLAELVVMGTVEQIDKADRVNRELVSSFIEHLASVLEGRKIADIKKAWIEESAAKLAATSEQKIL